MWQNDDGKSGSSFDRRSPLQPAGAIEVPFGRAVGADRLVPMRGFSLLLGLLLLSPPAWAWPHAVAHLKDLDGKPVGIATFVDGRSRRADRVRSHRPAARTAWHPSARLWQLRRQEPALPAPDPSFRSARWSGKHGYLAEGGPEAGDLPNQFAGADGRLHASVIASGFAPGQWQTLYLRPRRRRHHRRPAGRRLPHPAFGQCGRPHRLWRGGAHRGSAAAPSPLQPAKAAH